MNDDPYPHLRVRYHLLYHFLFQDRPQPHPHTAHNTVSTDSGTPRSRDGCTERVHRPLRPTLLPEVLKTQCHRSLCGSLLFWATVSSTAAHSLVHPFPTPHAMSHVPPVPREPTVSTYVPSHEHRYATVPTTHPGAIESRSGVYNRRCRCIEALRGSRNRTHSFLAAQTETPTGAPRHPVPGVSDRPLSTGLST